MDQQITDKHNRQMEMIKEEPSEISRIEIIITEMKSSLDELDSRLEMVGWQN